MNPPFKPNNNVTSNLGMINNNNNLPTNINPQGNYTSSAPPMKTNTPFSNTGGPGGPTGGLSGGIGGPSGSSGTPGGPGFTGG
eukprot:CAMPEP_0117009238 /NCGR_PEP_ID=MMETSP0472-20121206/8449_1 /TAXON_ID=693140 ORGANISM="Tiarina fusus, Strain LIS" /NCGR_SAMPLE_ID=MMETSP0472 /ASSEMBLY_ACC=CAM_ASM_000603 /LENGTH=82 /DNA_ID=CAMNT_0004711469 /DNA_START=731 /DNA_END=979 /DNA_ORIENTATION=-